MSLEESLVEQLRKALSGGLLSGSDPHYEQARLVWNGMIDRRPALIARCASVEDVVESVRFAREQELVLAVRGGGHGVAGNAVCDDGLVIDLSPLKAISIDPEKRTVRAGGGCTLGDLDGETQQFGLAVPLGVVSATGIAGLTLAGGIGWLRRKHGAACDNLVSADLVTADGRLLTTSETENSDLFWGIRGGGGNFGIVTSFEYQAHPIGPGVMFCFVVYPADQAREVLRACDDYVRNAPDEVSPLGVLGHVPHADPFPAAAHGQPYVALLAMYAGHPDEGASMLSPLRELGAPIIDLSQVLPYREAQSLLDDDYPDGRSYYWKSLDLDTLGDDAIERLVAQNAAARSHHSTIDIWFHGGAMSRVDPEATAFGRRPPYLIGFEGNWDDPAASADNVSWVREAVADLEPLSTGGSYLNFPGFFEEGDDLTRASYGERNFERLVQLKDAYDPTNLFRLNGNIKPTAR